MKRELDWFGSSPVSRRTVLQAGSLGLIGLSSADVAGWRATAAGEQGSTVASQPHKAIVYNFPMLKDFLYPPTDLAVSAFLDDF